MKQLQLFPTNDSVNVMRRFGFVGNSEGIIEVCNQAMMVAESDATVCIYGASGTGKELVAKAIHAVSPRRDHPFVIFDSTAIPEGLAESEMFGHVRGAFTSAVAERHGVFELADKGTLFLDEVGDLSLPIQAKLLRVVQSQEFRKVGGTKIIGVDVRLIAATNRNLAVMLREGEFREDLFYRLNVVSIAIPPLRERKGDIPALVAHFLNQLYRKGKRGELKAVSHEVLEVLCRYGWPGNVRELENCIERAVVMTPGSMIGPQSISLIVKGFRDEFNGSKPELEIKSAPSSELPSLRDVEREHILRVLDSVGGNKTRAARILGVQVVTMNRKLDKYQLETSRMPLRKRRRALTREHVREALAQCSGSISKAAEILGVSRQYLYNYLEDEDISG